MSLSINSTHTQKVFASCLVNVVKTDPQKCPLKWFSYTEMKCLFPLYHTSWHEVCLTSVKCKSAHFSDICLGGPYLALGRGASRLNILDAKLESHYWHIRVISWIGFPWFLLQNQVQLTSLRKCWFCLSLTYQLVRVMITVWCFYKRRLKCHTSSMTPLKVSDSHCL